MRCDECGGKLYQAGEVVPAGEYARVDDGSFRRLVLDRTGPLPATFDGHVAEYRDAATSCTCAERHSASVGAACTTPAAVTAQANSPIQI